ncbi:hypothetical protein D3C87_1733910 [compost metagenome]
MGSYGLYRLFIRFNSPDNYDLYRQWAGEIALNRSFYLLLALLLAAGAALLWERNRSRTDTGGGRRNKASGRKGKVEAAA